MSNRKYIRIPSISILVSIFIFANEPTLEWLNQMSSSGVCCSEKQIQTTKVDIPSNYGVDEAKITGITLSSLSTVFRKATYSDVEVRAFFHSAHNREITLRTRMYESGVAPKDVYRQSVYPNGIRTVKGVRILNFYRTTSGEKKENIGAKLIVDKEGYIIFEIYAYGGWIGSKLRIELTKNDTVARQKYFAYNDGAKVSMSFIEKHIFWSLENKRDICINIKEGIETYTNKNYKEVPIAGKHCIKYLLNRGNKLTN